MRPARWVAAMGLAVAPALLSASLAAADEPAGCDAFKWPLDHERTALVNPNKPLLPNGGAIAYDQATTLKLAPIVEAGLPHAPERPPKVAQSYAGHFTLGAPPKPGTYKVTIGAEGWIDVLDGGQFLHPTGFSGATGCDGARKSVKFDLPAHALDVQFSGVKDAGIAVIVSPGE